MGSDLEHAEFDDSFVRALPGEQGGTQSRRVSRVCYSLVGPTPVRQPRLLGWADDVGALLGLRRPQEAEAAAAQILGGNRLAKGMRPYAARYGGHQFGHWAGQLGDGRAITLGELSANGRRHELQLKGAGRTPYSRSADGRAVLRSSVREFLCSEAMFHLGVPTTRALSLVATGEEVVRDMFYDGRPQAEPGAIVCRVAPSFVRFGNFEILAAEEEADLLKQLADHVIRQHFPDLMSEGRPPDAETYARWFERICHDTARLVAHWIAIGFVHGVMNTDNMSILGLTIDYGPYGWLEGFDLAWTPNTTDAEGRRYCYGNQPNIAGWNLGRLADALGGLLDDEAARQGLNHFRATLADETTRHFAAKLGLAELRDAADQSLLDDLFKLLQASETDMTLFFRHLSDVSTESGGETPDDAALLGPLRPAFYDETVLAGEHGRQMAAWLRRYVRRSQNENPDPAERRRRMNRANPKYVLRNYLAQQAIDALTDGDAGPLERLMTVMRQPYDEQPGQDDLAVRRPEWARHRAGCSALSCSS